MVTDGKSTTPNKTDEEAHRVRDDGIALTAVGIKGKTQIVLRDIYENYE